MCQLMILSLISVAFLQQQQKATLKEHMNTKHQLDITDVEVVVQNCFNENKLKVTKQQIKELQDKVEDLSIGKARAECNVRILKVESDTLASLLSMRQILTTLSPSKAPRKI